jgi:PHD/YefM family antitoxin component YafN of YafNO toxin-antitoxin module
MTKTTATEFCRNFGHYRFEAQNEPIAVTSHGRTTGYFVSASEFAHYQALLHKERENLRVGHLPDDALSALHSSTYPEGHEDLDSLMDEEVEH